MPPAPHKPSTTLLRRSGQLYRTFRLLALSGASSPFWRQPVPCDSAQPWFWLPGVSVDHTGSPIQSSTRPSHSRLQPKVLEARPHLGPISCEFRGSHKLLSYSDCLRILWKLCTYCTGHSFIISSIAQEQSNERVTEGPISGIWTQAHLWRQGVPPSSYIVWSTSPSALSKCWGWECRCSCLCLVFLAWPFPLINSVRAHLELPCLA